MKEEKIKVIIDTDIGDDIDDALAIAYALKCPELEILGITTVFAEAHKRAVLTRALLSAAERDDIPVYAGCSDMLIHRIKKERIPCQYSPDMEKFTYNKDKTAVQFMADTINKYPGEVVLAPIGALTNVALLLKQYPNIHHKIKRIVWMGGAFYYHFITYNAACDIEATKVVFESGIPLTVVSRDVCMPCKMPETQIQQLKQRGTPLTDLLYTLIERWRSQFIDTDPDRLPILFDNLTLCAIFNRDYLSFKKERVLVETQGQYTRGLTFVVKANYRNFPNFDCYPKLEDIPLIEVAYDVNPEGFIKHHFERLMS